MDNHAIQPDGAAIKSKRAKLGWTQDKLEELSGVSKRVIQKAEASASIQSENLEFLATALQCSTLELSSKQVRNKAVIHRVYYELLNERKYEIVPEVYRHDVEAYDPFQPRPIIGIENLKNAALQFDQAFPNSKYRIESMVAENDEVFVRWSVAGFHTGAYSHYEPTDLHVDCAGVARAELKDGLVTKIWQFWSGHELIEKISFNWPPSKIDLSK